MNKPTSPEVKEPSDDFGQSMDREFPVTCADKQEIEIIRMLGRDHPPRMSSSDKMLTIWHEDRQGRPGPTVRYCPTLAKHDFTENIPN